MTKKLTNSDSANFYDEILEDVHKRKAQVIEDTGNWNDYIHYLKTLRPQMEKDGWVFVDPEEVQKKNLHRHLRTMQKSFTIP